MAQFIYSTSENQKIAFTERNESKNIGVVFIHGNSLNYNAFQKQFELDTNHKLIFMDLPGHGSSSYAEQPDKVYSIAGYCSIISDFINSFNLAAVVLVGHSLGGHLALNTAKEIKNLKGIVSFGAPYLGIPPAMDKAFLPNPSIGLAFQGELSDEQINELATAYWGKENPPNWMINSIKATDPDARFLFAQSMAAGKMNNELDLLKNLQVPIAVFHGSEENLVNGEYFETLEIPTLWKREVQLFDGGHCFHLESYEEFNKTLRLFFNETL